LKKLIKGLKMGRLINQAIKMSEKDSLIDCAANKFDKINFSFHFQSARKRFLSFFKLIYHVCFLVYDTISKNDLRMMNENGPLTLQEIYKFYSFTDAEIKILESRMNFVCYNEKIFQVADLTFSDGVNRRKEWREIYNRYCEKKIAPGNMIASINRLKQNEDNLKYSYIVIWIKKCNAPLYKTNRKLHFANLIDI